MPSEEELLIPPAIRTLPFASSVAVCWPRGESIAPDAVKVPAVGSKTSVVLMTVQLPPPAISTFPFGSKVAVCQIRWVIGSAPAVKLSVAGE